MLSFRHFVRRCLFGEARGDLPNYPAIFARMAAGRTDDGHGHVLTEPVNTWARASFILPSGQRIMTYSTHQYTLDMLGGNLIDALKHGLVRVADTKGVQVGAPLTEAQLNLVYDLARNIVDNQRDIFYIATADSSETGTPIPDEHYLALGLAGNRFTADTIRNWVKTHV